MRNVDSNDMRLILILKNYLIWQFSASQYLFSIWKDFGNM